jgi:hypothetical protein
MESIWISEKMKFINETEKTEKLNSSAINEENLQIYFYLIRGLA